jgi:hypothetical protein
MIYGYSIRRVSDHDLLELKELTFEARPAFLRDVASFLAEMADLVETGAFEHCRHRHIDGFIEGWNERYPGRNIIVARPGGISDLPRVAESVRGHVESPGQNGHEVPDERAGQESRSEPL